jgi:hypothetical protein
MDALTITVWLAVGVMLIKSGEDAVGETSVCSTETGAQAESEAKQVHINTSAMSLLLFDPLIPIMPDLWLKLIQVLNGMCTLDHKFFNIIIQHRIGRVAFFAT